MHNFKPPLVFGHDLPYMWRYKGTILQSALRVMIPQYVPPYAIEIPIIGLFLSVRQMSQVVSYTQRLSFFDVS